LSLESAMDELDVKILRALMFQGAAAPSTMQVNSSLRSIAARIGANDMTVIYRYKRLKESGALSGWQLVVNPMFFGCKLMYLTVDVQPESAKSDIIRKLKLVHEIAGMADFYGSALRLIVMFNSEESRSRIVELVSRITNSERVVQAPWILPQCRTGRLTGTDVSIIRALADDSRKSFVQVSKELGLSTRTVRNRVIRLRKEGTVFPLPTLNVGGIPGFLQVFLSYSYSKDREKGAVDRAMLSHFAATYLSFGFADPDNGFIYLSAATMNEVRDHLEWAKSQPGVASARTDVLVRNMVFPEKLIELLERRDEKSAVQMRAFF
jgi:DNA-binding Lrp family transcriptional regulator